MGNVAPRTGNCEFGSEKLDSKSRNASGLRKIIECRSEGKNPLLLVHVGPGVYFFVE